MSSKMRPKKQIIEESVEAKPRNTVSEPTTISNELRQLADQATKTAWEDLLAGSVSSFSEQVLGTSGGDLLAEGQEVSLSAKKSSNEKGEKKPVSSEQHMEYFRTVKDTEGLGEVRTEMQVKQAVDEIRMEIKKLIQTSKIVERTVKDATADQAPVKPGKYHITFFEFVLSVIKDATRKLEDTATYGAVFTSKKQQSKYWSSYKKHGTSFGLSGERSTATQTG